MSIFRKHGRTKNGQQEMNNRTANTPFGQGNFNVNGFQNENRQYSPINTPKGQY